jgi:hypothetical protein
MGIKHVFAPVIALSRSRRRCIDALLGIMLSATPGRQTGKAQAVQRIVDTGQRIRDPELVSKKALGVFRSPCADAVGFGRFG